MTYRPQPIDTKHVTLSPQILEMREQLARNAHDVWAQRRIADGWSYGPVRDDGLKHHPSLLPYDHLPEEAKEYNRNLAIETLRAMLALNYQLVPPEGDTSRQGQRSVAAEELLRQLQDPDLKAPALHGLWRERRNEAAAWGVSAEPYARLARRLLRLGSPLLANEVTTEGMEYWPGQPDLRRVQGLALARSGLTERANEVLAQLYQEQVRDEDTLGLLARTHKDLWLLKSDPADRQRELLRSYELYLEAYRLHKGYWTGINAATLATFLGNETQARDLAREVRGQCLQQLATVPDLGMGDRYWALATLGEAALNLGEWSEAEDYYGQAGRAAPGWFGELNTTRRQARLLVKHLNRDTAFLERCLPMPRVVVFSGHMIDRPDRRIPRFPPELESFVDAEIRARLKKLNALVGYSSGASGADLLFLEAIRDLHGEMHVVLPYDEKQFIQDSVNPAPGSNWEKRFKAVVENATQVVTASSQKMQGGSVSYDYANLVLHGLASVRAGELETELVALTVWDGRPGDGPGGTASIVERWRRLGVPIEHIHVGELLQQHLPKVAAEAAAMTPRPPRVKVPTEQATFLMAMLFADAVNFSKLTEEQVPLFVQHFLGTIADLLQQDEEAAVVRNTWGDGLYLVFNSVRDAGLFALELCERIKKTNWKDHHLPETLSLRVALHAGPVFRCMDPVTGRLNYTGTHVSRAARIEPITPPGQVYASQAFAALASVERVTEFTCEFVKQAEWAKNYGTFPTYLLRRRSTRPDEVASPY